MLEQLEKELKTLLSNKKKLEDSIWKLEGKISSEKKRLCKGLLLYEKQGRGSLDTYQCTECKRLAFFSISPKNNKCSKN